MKCMNVFFRSPKVIYDNVHTVYFSFLKTASTVFDFNFKKISV